MLYKILDFFSSMTYYNVTSGYKTRKGEENRMGIIVCQSCDAMIDHVEEEKVSVLYSTCDQCKHEEE
ncbi:GapA-binding peptide SR1P [Heyndrickxia coagulans]|uniref:GapA-binding peptide SR1P n=1 Tax=Heyndrickxia coagulans TaxID=1398 RepID=UPI00031A2276